ncbi:nuclear pore complex protein Nup85-like [Rhopilema esculentum]|uniref:nuclear pore complex protein Nup85-like n=1 Tax=Rhopilema esculentum TaxID=499914 RepID=UPI0031D1A393
MAEQLDEQHMDSENFPASNQTVINEPLADGKLAGKWKSVNCIVVHAKKWPTVESTQTEDVSGKVTMREMRWQADTQHYIYRKLINETHAIFKQLQLLPKDEGHLMKSTRLKISRQYRSVLQSCIVELQRKLSKEDNFEDEEMKYQLELLAIVEMFWHLCEIILIDTKPGGYCITVLLEWVRWHFTKADRLAEQVLFSDDPSSHESFWPAILGYVLQGRMTEAMKLLQHFADDSEAAFKAVKSMEELMKSMPEFQGFTGQYVQDFNQKWYHWRNECEGRLEDGEFSEHPHLESISKIFCGQESAIEENSDLCQSWYEILIAKLLYTEATIKKTDLHSRSLSAVEAIGGYAALSPLDEVVLAILNFDVHRMIRKCSECLPNWWFVAHITDLLHHCGMLKEHDFGCNVHLREFLLLDYSQSLMSNHSLWQVAADYLSTCPTQGRAQLEVYIEHVPLENDRKAAKVLRLCEQYDLLEQANGICKVMAMRAMKHGRLGASLTWCLRSKDSVFANLLAEKIFTQYMETGTLSDLDIIDNLGSAMLLSDKLTFLGKYREFHKLYNEENFQEAGKLLMQLLSSSLAPQRFWMTLLTDALPMLEHEKIIFSSTQTYEIMHCLQELQLSINSKEYFGQLHCGNINEQQDDEKDKLALLRLGLSRNLARVLLQEKCASR